MSVIAAIFIPFVIDDSKQAQFISKWIQVETNTKYFFSVFKVTHNDFIKDLDGDKKVSEDEIFKHYLKYLNDENIKEIDTKNYTYRYLNNKTVPKNSLDYISKIVEKGDEIIGFTHITDKCNDKNIPCDRLYFDVNGYELPNKFGKDIFGFNIYRSKVEPFGYGENYYAIKQDCSRKGTGLFCSVYYSKGGHLN